MRKVLRIIILMVFVLLANIGGFWARYILYADSPYDEIGIELNSRMPAPLNRWGCEKLHARFPGYIPPYGCTWPYTLKRR